MTDGTKLFEVLGKNREYLFIDKKALDMRKLKKPQLIMGLSKKMRTAGLALYTGGTGTTIVGAHLKKDAVSGFGVLTAATGAVMAYAGNEIEDAQKKALTKHIQKVGWEGLLTPSALKKFKKEGFHKKFKPNQVIADFGHKDKTLNFFASAKKFIAKTKKASKTAKRARMPA